jgi:hypothetical protein
MNDTMIVGMVLVVFVAAVAYYLMMRVGYLEKKMGLMEAVLIDIKVALESIEQEQEHVPPPPLPATSVLSASVGGSVGGSSGTAAPVEPSDEKFYSSVLDQVHEEAAEEKAAEAAEAAEEAAVAEEAEEEKVAATKVGPNYDGMTRTELVALAEQRGLRVPKRLSRGEVISLLRGSESSRNDDRTTGTENASGPTGSIFSTAAAVDGSFPVDLGQGLVSEEVNL